MSLRVWVPFLVLALATIGRADGPADEVVARVQARYDETSDLTALVEQELLVLSAGRTVKASGSVAFKRPGKMRWVLEGEDKQVIVANGKTLWFYQQEEEQVIRAPFEAAFRSATPISFLTGVGRIKDDFDARMGEPEEGVLRLVLEPHTKEAEVGRLELSVDPKEYNIVGAKVTDPFGNVTQIRLREIRRNVGLDDELFEFEVPPGVDVVEAPIGY